MPERGEEVFSNPLPPADYRRESTEEDPGATPLTNDDFRKLLMTPRATPGEAPPSKPKAGESMPMPKEYNEEDDPSARRRKKKSFYAKLKKQEMEREAELAKKYRDRAQERREGKNDDYDDTDVISTTANYRAVAPDAQSGDSAANRRKQLIEESKYLGGDMEHTHLVKGLDYALLHKVRAEITSKEKEEEDAIETSFQAKPIAKEKIAIKIKVKDDPKIEFKTNMARNIYRILFQAQPPQRNELYLPGRLAYNVDLDDEFSESDIPTMLIRSKADCPTMESHTTLTTNDIVINKLTQILSYLRQGQRGRKLKKKEKGKLGKDSQLDKVAAAEDIFADVGSYVPNHNKSKKEKEHEREQDRDKDRDRDRDSRRDRDRERGRGRDREERDRERDREDRDRDRSDRDKERDRKPRNYFEKPKIEDEPSKEASAVSSKDMAKSITDKYGMAAEMRFAGTWQPAEEWTLPRNDVVAEVDKDVKNKFKWGWMEHKVELKRNGEVIANSFVEGSGIAKVDIIEEKREREKGIAFKGGEKKVRGSKRQKGAEPDSYAECYPGAMETADALDDSDDEVDYSKMDQGNKKGPIGRWDFDTQEEYSRYMNQKEAMPKAAFQFGIKMSEGRKTRRIGGEKNEKAELDREWQQISQILAKRKSDPSTGSDRYKKPKY